MGLRGLDATAFIEGPIYKGGMTYDMRAREGGSLSPLFQTRKWSRWSCLFATVFLRRYVCWANLAKAYPPDYTLIQLVCDYAASVSSRGCIYSPSVGSGIGPAHRYSSSGNSSSRAPVCTTYSLRVVGSLRISTTRFCPPGGRYQCFRNCLEGWEDNPDTDYQSSQSSPCIHCRR